MTFKEAKNLNEGSVESLFKKLEKKDNSMSYQLEKIEHIFWEASNENTQALLIQMNSILEKDEWVMKKWDFMKTLQNLKLDII